MFIAGKLKSHVAAGPQIMPGARTYQHWPRQPGQKFFTHGQAANGFIHRRDHDTGGAFDSARNRKLRTLAGVNGSPWLDNHAARGRSRRTHRVSRNTVDA